VFVRPGGDGDLHAGVGSRESGEAGFEEFAVALRWMLVVVDFGSGGWWGWEGDRETYFIPRLLPAQSQ
jgi:hypothetical protein